MQSPQEVESKEENPANGLLQGWGGDCTIGGQKDSEDLLSHSQVKGEEVEPNRRICRDLGSGGREWARLQAVVYDKAGGETGELDTGDRKEREDACLIARCHNQPGSRHKVWCLQVWAAG